MESRLRGRAAVLGATVPLLAASILLVAFRLWLPSDHGQVDHAALGAPARQGLVVLVREPLPGGLRDGDRVIAVDGVPVASADTGLLDVTTRAPRTGRTLHYVVVRDGERLQLTVDRGPYPLASLLTGEWSSFVFIAAMLLIGMYVFARRPDDPAARAMLVMSAALAGSTASFLMGLEVTDFLAGPAILLILAGNICYLLFYVGLLWFAFEFAKPRRWSHVAGPLLTGSAAIAIALTPIVALAAVALRVPAVDWMAGLGLLSDVFALPFLALTSAVFVLGYRDSASAEHRERIRLVAIVLGGATLLALVGEYVPMLLIGQPLIPWSASGLLGLPLPVAIGLSIVRHGAFDIRVAINRSLVYGSLTLVIIGVYVGVLAAIGLVVREQAGFATSLVATGAVAVVVQPLRDVLQRAINRLMYGDRDEPYVAISRLGQRLAASLTPDEVLPALAETVTRAMRVPYGRLECSRGRDVEVVGMFGDPVDEVEEVPLKHRGELVGRLVVGRRGAGDAFSAADLHLLDDLARQSAPAVHAVLLVVDLERTRRNLVTVCEEERRLLRRGLHDEVGPTLAAIGLRLESARATLATDTMATRRALAELRRDPTAVIADVRRIVQRLGPRDGDPTAWVEPEREPRPADRDGVPRITQPSPAVGEAQTAAPVEGIGRDGWLVIAFGIALIVAALLQLSVRIGGPSDGWSLTPDASGSGREWQFVFDERLRGEATDIKPGDRLEAIDGLPVATLLADVVAGRGTSVPGWTDGGSVTYRVTRGGRLVDVQVPLRTATPAGVATALAHQIGMNVGFTLLVAIAAFAVWRRPRVPAARLLWLFAAAVGASTIVEAVGGPAPTVADLLDPAAFWSFEALSGLVWPIIVGPVIAHLFLVFPRRAELLRRRPKAVLGVLYGGAIVLLVAHVAASRGALQEAWPAYAITGSIWMFGVIALAAARLALLARRERDPEARAQVRWVALGLLISFGLAVPSGVLWFFGFLDPRFLLDAARVYVIAFPVTLAIAILQHRLFDIDVALSRTFVFAALTTLVVLIYVATVAALGQIVAQTFAVSLIATGVVAVLVQPMRSRLQRAINRLLYGERDDPYAVVSRLGQRLEATVAPEALLPAVADTVAQALRLPFVAIELDLPENRVEIAAMIGHPRPAAATLPLVYQGLSIGRLLVATRAPGESFGPADRALLAELARQTGRVAYAVRLRRDLDESRARLIAARAEERGRVRRDLHDDLGPGLAAIAVKLEAAQALLDHEPDAADRLLASLGPEVQSAIGDIRRIVYDLRPPALDELGLVGAIRQQASRLEVDVHARGAGVAAPVITIDAPEIAPALPAAVEVAAYRIALEAVTNVLKHARADHCRVRIRVEPRDEDAALVLEVLDDGVGITVNDRKGVGLDSMRQRAAEVGGTFRVERAADGGTRLSASLPLPAGRQQEQAA